MDAETKKNNEKRFINRREWHNICLIGVDFKRQNRKYYEKSNQIL
tara:strand:+ start:220 stop:354 length:135 start_codon:yes stop_codon:yes gene_type:complete